MIIVIEPQSDVPIYTQLTNQIIEGIARGYLNPGDSLPSVRAFAADLGVNMHTVNKSYHELVKKGIISIIPKSGAVINSPEVTDEISAQLIKELKPLIVEAMVLGFEKTQIHHLVEMIVSDLEGKS